MSLLIESPAVGRTTTWLTEPSPTYSPDGSCAPRGRVGATTRARNHRPDLGDPVGGIRYPEVHKGIVDNCTTLPDQTAAAVEARLDHVQEMTERRQDGPLKAGRRRRQIPTVQRRSQLDC